MQPGPATGAQCAIHSGVGAPSVCARCGNFMCVACSSNQSERYCPTCRPLMKGSDFPLGADAGFDQVWDYCFERFKVEWLMLTIGVVIFLGFAMVGGLMSNVVSAIINSILGLKIDPARPWSNLRDFAISTGISQVIATLLSMPLMGIAIMGLYRMCLDVLEGRKADVARMFSQLHLLPKYVVMQLIIYVAVTIPLYVGIAVLGFLSLKVAGVGLSLDAESLRQWTSGGGPVVVAIGLLLMMAALVFVLPVTIFSVPELMVSNCEPIEALRRAFQMASGQRLRLLGYSIVGLVVTMLGALACCVGMVPASISTYLLWMAAFLIARKRSALV